MARSCAEGLGAGGADAPERARAPRSSFPHPPARRWRLSGDLRLRPRPLPARELRPAARQAPTAAAPAAFPSLPAPARPSRPAGPLLPFCPRDDRGDDRGDDREGSRAARTGPPGAAAPEPPARASPRPGRSQGPRVSEDGESPALAPSLRPRPHFPAARGEEPAARRPPPAHATRAGSPRARPGPPCAAPSAGEARPRDAGEGPAGAEDERAPPAERGAVMPTRKSRLAAHPAPSGLLPSPRAAALAGLHALAEGTGLPSLRPSRHPGALPAGAVTGVCGFLLSPSERWTSHWGGVERTEEGRASGMGKACFRLQ